MKQAAGSTPHVQNLLGQLATSDLLMGQIHPTGLPKQTLDSVGHLSASGHSDKTIHRVFVILRFATGAPCLIAH